MHKGFLRLASLLGALSVGLGAFGAHGLRQVLSADTVNIFDTAVRYQFYHVFALLAVGILYKRFPVKWLRYAGYFFFIGVVLFSGSLYVLTAAAAAETTGLKGVGFVTPFGGLFLVVGWLCLFFGISSSVRTARTGQSNKL